MRVKLFLLGLAILCLTADLVNADFLYDRTTPDLQDLEKLGYKCKPGRTVIKVQEKEIKVEKGSSSEEDDDYVATDGRRTHMNFPAKDESCQMCVCSVEGKDEYCSKRPAMNVNECMRMATLMEKFKQNMPFGHERDLANRIRRDYLWNNDEIPYDPKAKCQRGHSYYSNSINANDTDIDVATDVESLLDYSDHNICFYCVCSVHGKSVGCISRNPWFCEYYRVIREKGAARDMYTQTFEQDRPAYFRQLSYRLRRTMDSGMFDLIDAVGSGTEKYKKCVPFVSQYSDCIDENQCGGCSKCTCTAKGTWSCEKVNKCEKMFETAPVNDNDVDVALLMMESAMKQERKKAASSSKYQFVPMPSTENSLLLEVTTEKEFNIEDDIMDLLRPKRSVAEPKDVKNATVKFYHTVDEVNEDTLKNTNESGTIKAKKLEVDLPKLSRRAGGLLPDNTSNPLHIEYNKADVYQHINDNKIDATHHHEDLIHEVLANYSQKQKDRDVSKVIVKEMKSGTEIIGDKNAPIMSNVSFTPENETFVAMTYIAGNLLNKLWNMETDSSETIETELLKHERIAELLDLFKEPLSINQEMLLKNAIEQLSSVIDKNKDLKNVSLCHQLGEVKEFLNNANFSEEKNCNKDKTKDTEAVSNVDNVINLVKKLKNVQSHMDTLKTTKEQVETKDFETQKDSGFGKYANTPINLLGGIFEGVTKLLLPSKNGKKLSNRMRNLHIFGKDYELSNRFKNIFNIALGNITMTTKDKIVLDYLTHIDNSPDCLLHGKRPKAKPKAPTNIEGNILLNLSEFFKMKSLNDLLQMLGKDNKTNITNNKNKNNAVFRSQYTTETITEATTIKTQIIKGDTNRLTATKEKLKMHLKTILEDLVEMQNAKDVTKKTDIKLTDVLPCIYNILNADRPVDNTNGKDNSIDKLSGIFTNLKQELKFASYRRSNTIKERPKSAIVWERLVKNLKEKQKLTRRTMNEIPPKSVIELKNMIEALESSSNTYKNIAILTNVPPHERLTLLKTLDADIKKYIVALENIKKSLQAGIIPNNKIAEFNEYVDNMANVININGKVLKKISRPKFRPLIVENIETKQKLNRLSYNLAARQEYTLPKEPVAFNTKITRDQVINQLIKNRINTYIRIKEATGIDLSDDINYDIAKKILFYLEGGNNMLARELYNIFANRQKLSNGVSGANSGSTKIDINKYSGPAAIFDKEPLIQFEEPKRRVTFPSQNNLIQQLINMKNMGM